MLNKVYLCDCCPKNEKHCLWPVDYSFPTLEGWEFSPFYTVPSIIVGSAFTEHGDLASLATPNAWVQSSIINAFLIQFNSGTCNSVHFADCQIMINWVTNVEEQYGFKCKSMSGNEKGNSLVI